MSDPVCSVPPLMHRVLAYMGTMPDGTETTAAYLAERLGLHQTLLRAPLEAALAAGLVSVRTRHAHPRAPRFWSLAL